MLTLSCKDRSLQRYYVFFVAVSLSPLQIYAVSIYGFYISVAVVAAYACYAFIPLGEFSPAHKVSVPLLAMLVWMAMVVPVHQEKIPLVKIIFYNMPFVPILICGYCVAISKADWRTPFYVAIVFSSINAVLIIVFRIHHPIEQYFYQFPAAKIFINPNRVDYILRAMELANSFVDSRKAGGFFPNANYGAVFSGVSCLLSYGLYRATSRKILLIASLLLLSAVPATGSKPAFLASLAVALWVFFRERKGCRIAIAMCLCASLAISFSAGDIAKQFNENALGDVSKQSRKMLTYHAHNTAANCDTRLQLWQYSYNLLLKRPLQGNSPDHQEAVGGIKLRVMQPHNVYLKVGVYFGIPALLFAALFHFGMLRSLFKATQAISPQYKDFALCTLLSFCWVVAQGLISNAEPVGEFHSAALLAGMSGVTLGLAFPKTQD